MTAYYDFFRYVKLYSPDGTTLEQTIEADNVTDSINLIRGNGVAWNNVDLGTDTFKIDVEYNLSVPVASTTLRLTDINSANDDIELIAGTNISIVRNSSSQLTFSALVGGVSKSISNISLTNPVRIVTTNQHDFAEGTPVTIVDVVGTTQLNGNEYWMDVIDGTTFDIYTDENLTVGVDGTAFSAYVSGGVATADYGGAKQAFKTIAVTGQPDIVADNLVDTLTFTGGTGIDLTSNASTDTITIDIDTTVITGTGAQTLTNKTIAFQNNSISMLLSELNTAVTDTDVVGIDETQTLTNKTLTSPVISSISNTGTLTLPTSTDTLVGRATTDTLTNKSIDLASNTVTMTLAELQTAVSNATIVDTAGTQTLTNKTLTTPTITTPVINAGADLKNGATSSGFIKFFEDSDNGTNSVTLIAASALTADHTITLPDATGNIVLPSTTDTLTNKSINLTNNTVTGTFAEFNTAVSDATLVDLDDTQTLTNKTINGTDNTLTNIANASLTNSTITVTDGTTSTATALGGTITFSGTTNEVEVGESAGTITVGLPSSVAVTTDLAVGGTKNANYTLTNVGSMILGSNAASSLGGEAFAIDDGTITAKITVTGGVAQFGTKSNHPMDIYTVNGYRARFTTAGHFLVGSTDDGGMVNIKNTTAGAAERGLWVESTPAAGTSPNNVAVFYAGNANLTTPVVRIHHEAPTADQLMLQLTTTGSNTVVFSVDEDGDVAANSITGSIPGMTWMQSYGDDTAIGDAATTITRYAGPGTDFTANTSSLNYPVTANCKVVSLGVYISGTMTAGSATATITKNGTDTTTTITVPNGGSGYYSTTTSTSFDAGDRIGLKVVSIAGTANSFYATSQIELV